MNKFTVILVLMFLFVINLIGQSYLGKQNSLQLEIEDAVELCGGSEDINKMADFFFALDYNDVLQKAKAKGMNPEIVEGTIYIDGKLFRMDMESMGQKMSAILNLETREIYSIMHEQKQYFVMNLDEMKAMQAQIKNNMAAQMENMKGMMDNLPPEAKAMMEKMAGKKSTVPPKVTQTGKTRTLNGFSCEEILVSKEFSRDQLWITSDYSDLREAFYEMTNAMPMENEETKAQWEIIKEGWPVQTTTVSGKEGIMAGSVFINEMSSLKKATHKAGTFDPPSGYTKKTMQDMMGGMQ